MPEFDSTTRTKIAALRAIYLANGSIETHELVKVDWPSPDGTQWYAVHQTDEVASIPPPIDDPIEARIIRETTGDPSWFLPLTIDATIGDEEVGLKLWDGPLDDATGDGAVSDLLVAHGEGIKVEMYYWFPQGGGLLLRIWQGHLRFEDDAEPYRLPLKVAQGFRSADATAPGRPHYPTCQAVFGGLLDTQAKIDEGDCPFNFHLGGSIGNNDPDTGLPWTFCDRRRYSGSILIPGSCADRGVNPIFFLAHRGQSAIVVNNQTSGPRLYSTSHGNETSLKEPVRVVMGTRRIYDMQNMAYRQDLNNNNPEHGWYDALYEGPEGPIANFSNQYFRVDGRWQLMNPLHYGHRLGYKGQTVAFPDISNFGYSSSSYMRYNFGWIDPQTVEPGEATATAIVQGLANIRVYTDDDTYTEQYTSNRAWQIMRMMCDKRWGFGLDYARFNKASWIAAAAWVAEHINYTDPFGTVWTHVRGESHVELVGRKIQQQIEDMCVAGRLSLPFIFDGEVHIMPLAALTEDELADCPVFTDTGSDRNVIWEDGMTTLRISRKSDLDLPNRIECTYDAYLNDYYETPLPPLEDVPAQLRAGRVVGDGARKVNKKEYTLLGVVNESQAMKLGNSLLDLGPMDQGGLRNNLTITFKAWYMDTLDLHNSKVIRYVSPRLEKYGFEYFRVQKMERSGDLGYQITAQAYNPEYMNSFESVTVDPPDIDPGGLGGDVGTFGGSGHGHHVGILDIEYIGGVIDIGVHLI